MPLYHGTGGDYFDDEDDIDFASNDDYASSSDRLPEQHRHAGDGTAIGDRDSFTTDEGDDGWSDDSGRDSEAFDNYLQARADERYQHTTELIEEEGEEDIEKEGDDEEEVYRDEYVDEHDLLENDYQGNSGLDPPSNHQSSVQEDSLFENPIVQEDYSPEDSIDQFGESAPSNDTSDARLIQSGGEEIQPNWPSGGEGHNEQQEQQQQQQQQQQQSALPAHYYPQQQQAQTAQYFAGAPAVAAAPFPPSAPGYNYDGGVYAPPSYGTVAPALPAGAPHYPGAPAPGHVQEQNPYHQPQGTSGDARSAGVTFADDLKYPPHSLHASEHSSSSSSRPVPVYKATSTDDETSRSNQTHSQHSHTSVSLAESHKRDRRLVTLLLVFLGCAILCLGAVVGGVLGAVVFNRNEDEGIDGNSVQTAVTATPTIAPTVAPTQAPAAQGDETNVPPAAPLPPGGDYTPGNQNLFSAIQAAYEAASIDAAAVVTSGTPQNLAYLWLEEDFNARGGDSDGDGPAVAPGSGPSPDSGGDANGGDDGEVGGSGPEPAPEPAPAPGPAPEPAPEPVPDTAPEPSPGDGGGGFGGGGFGGGGFGRRQLRPKTDNDPGAVDHRSLQAGMSDERYIQRYALAVFYYSTEGTSWANSNGWLTEQPECSWHNDAQSACQAGTEVISHLEFAENNQIGTLPPELGLLSLKTFSIVSDPEVGGLTGSIPKELGRASNMETFKLTGNAFNAPLDSSLFENWTQLKELAMGQNGIPGGLPFSIGALAAVETLNLADNKFNGRLPPEIGNLKAATQFVVSRNELSGSLPPEIGDLDAVRSLLLADNRFNGALPTEIGSLKSLKGVLDLSNNGFTGSVLPELGELTTLKILRLNGNSFSGEIPEALSQLTNLSEFKFQENELSGTVPQAVCDALEVRSAESYADCTGEIECSCCTHCCETDPSSCT